MKYTLVFILTCLSLAHDAKPTVTDATSDPNPTSGRTTTTPDPSTDSPSSNSGSDSEKGLKVSKTVSKFMATVRESPSDLYLCSATFIRRDALLTTARCLFGRDPKKLSVHSNSSNLEIEGPGNTAIKNVYLHPDFEMIPAKMDFAVITLGEFVDNITPVSLPYKRLGRPGTMGMMYNWRFTPTTNKFLIHEHQSKIISNPKCFLSERDIIPDDMVCAEGLQYQEGKYDRGMPFIINKKGKNYLFGLNFISGKPVTVKVDKVWKIYGIVPWITLKLRENDIKSKRTNHRAGSKANSEFSYTYGEEEEEEEEWKEEKEEEWKEENESEQSYTIYN